MCWARSYAGQANRDYYAAFLQRAEVPHSRHDPAAAAASEVLLKLPPKPQPKARGNKAASQSTSSLHHAASSTTDINSSNAAPLLNAEKENHDLPNKLSAAQQSFASDTPAHLTGRRQKAYTNATRAVIPAYLPQEAAPLSSPGD